MSSTQSRLLLVLLGTTFLAGLLLATACERPPAPTASSDPSSSNPSSNNTVRPEGTERMVRRLARIVDDTPVMSNVFLSAERLAFLRTLEIPADPVGRVRAKLDLANELLRAGHSHDAAIAFEEVIAEVAADPSRHPDGLVGRLRSQLAVAHLRLGEQENCIERHSPDACLMPIRGSGVHQIERGSRAALAVYDEILRDDPDDLMSRWLYNVAAMTVSEYPDGVPAEWLIPPEVFDSQHDVGPLLRRRR